MKLFYSTCAICLLLFNFVSAQLPSQLSTGEILLAIEKLRVTGSVLYVAAHPDDENTRLLGYLARERKFRTGYLSITRGDGGQNLIGKEQGDLLGLIRTQELLAARRVDGAEQFFTRACDFGYSKNPEETFRFWNKDSVLSDVVWVIRHFKPDVIICRFPVTGEGGHGHHTASAILAQEAFNAAGDASRFTWQLAYTQPWKTRRIFWNTFNFGGNNTTSPDQLKIDVGAFNPLIGKGYGEISSESRSMHKSQGFGSARTRGKTIEYFKFLKGDSVLSEPFENMDFTWGRFQGLEQFNKLTADCADDFDARHPEKSIPVLIQIYKELKKVSSQDPGTKYWVNRKLAETESLILACSGLWMEAYASEFAIIPGTFTDVTLQIIQRNESETTLNKITFPDNSDSTVAASLKTNELMTIHHRTLVPSNTGWSNPYWLDRPHSEGLFTVSDPKLIGTPENSPAMKVRFSLDIGGEQFEIERGLSYKFTDPVKGEVYRPLEILPPVTAAFEEKVFVYSDTQPKKIRLTVHANRADQAGTIEVMATPGWNVQLAENTFNLKNKGNETSIDLIVTPRGNSISGKITVKLKTPEGNYSHSIHRIEYDHIPYQFYLSEASAGLSLAALKKTGTNIGYIAGAGDDIPACLKQIGYDVTVLSDEDLTSGDLSRYQAIVTGVRAYNTEEKMQVYYDRLMNYVRNGGNLVVQYNTNNRIGPLLAKIGPFPFTISRDRVTDEKCEVRMLHPEHPVLNTPNKISKEDFDGWIQERGIYFATETDSNYVSVLSMNDPGDKPMNGGLIVGSYGKGNFVYTGLSFFRELPAGVPGAYRLFTNLISLPSRN